jgi:CubicO group peptidase (beta-lactamase class C family)
VTWYLRTQVDSAFPGATVAIGRHGRMALVAAVGHYSTTDHRPVTPRTMYDLASLTKVVGWTTACMQLADRGLLDLDAPVSRYVAEFRWRNVTIRDLLTHTAGFPPDLPLWQDTKTREQAFALADTAPLANPPGKSYVYSDVSAIIGEQVVERITGQRLDQYLAAHVFGPLGMAATRYLPPDSWRALIAPTEVDTILRHRLIWGTVHDESADRLGGVSGNAGLFSNALDLSRFATMLLDGGAWDTLTIVHAETVAEFTRRQDFPPGSSRALGWDTPSQPSSAGTRMSDRAFGHTGFTGTSIWIDPGRDLFVILLTNRVNPTRANLKIAKVRPRVADLVAQALTHPEL